MAVAVHDGAALQSAGAVVGQAGRNSSSVTEAAASAWAILGIAAGDGYRKSLICLLWIRRRARLVRVQVVRFLRRE